MLLDCGSGYKLGSCYQILEFLTFSRCLDIICFKKKGEKGRLTEAILTIMWVKNFLRVEL